MQIISIDNIKTKPLLTYSTGLDGLDKTLNGGIYEGSVVLLSGMPGVGKSTLIMQVANFIGKNHKILFVCGEESLQQAKLRADKLDVNCPNIFCTEEIVWEQIVKGIDIIRPQIVIIDSLQRIKSVTNKSAPGSAKQNRYCLEEIIRLAKDKNITFVVIGTSIKSRAVAGEQALQHMADTVIFMDNLDGKKTLLKVQKNRFGRSGETWEAYLTNTGFQESHSVTVNGQAYRELCEELIDDGLSLFIKGGRFHTLKNTLKTITIDALRGGDK